MIGPIYKEWKSRGLEVLAVVINADAAQRIPEFRERFGVTYPLTIGNPSLMNEFAQISAVRRLFVPYIFLIDRKGVIRFEHEGADHAFYQNAEANMRAELDLLLRESATAKRKTPAKPSAKR